MKDVKHDRFPEHYAETSPVIGRWEEGAWFKEAKTEEEVLRQINGPDAGHQWLANEEEYNAPAEDAWDELY